MPRQYTPEQREAQRARVRAHYAANKQYYLDKTKARNALLAEANREKLIAYLREHPCMDCGNTDIEVLQFDHRDGTEKKFNIGNAWRRYNWSAIEEEIAKCDTRCANCHQKRTRRQFGWWLDEMPH